MTKLEIKKKNTFLIRRYVKGVFVCTVSQHLRFPGILRWRLHGYFPPLGKICLVSCVLYSTETYQLAAFCPSFWIQSVPGFCVHSFQQVAFLLHMCVMTTQGTVWDIMTLIHSFKVNQWNCWNFPEAVLNEKFQIFEEHVQMTTGTLKLDVLRNTKLMNLYSTKIPRAKRKHTAKMSRGAALTCTWNKSIIIKEKATNWFLEK